MGYIVGLLGDDDPDDERFIVDFTDANAKAVYDLSNVHQIGFTAVWGMGNLESNREPGQLLPNDVNSSETHQWVFYGQWTFTPNSRFIAQTKVVGLGGFNINKNIGGLTLLKGDYRQFGLRNDIDWVVSPSHHIEFGLYLRSLHGTGVERRYSPTPSNIVSFDRQTWQQGYYAQDTWTNRRSRLALTAGARVDRIGFTGQTVFLPRAAISFSPFENSRLHLGWGLHAQFPGFAELFGIRGNPNLRAERATHFNAGIDYLFGTKTRLLVEAYDRDDKSLIFTLAESLIQSGQPVFVSFPQRNSIKGYSRGLEVMLQRRSTNRLTGWVSYSYSKTRLTDVVSRLSFPSDFDQRHTVSMYGSYRLNDTWNLSTQWRHGSGLPLVGFFRLLNGQVVLGSERNHLRLPAYSRVDFRINKAFHFKRSKLTISGEVLNVLNRENVRQDGRGTEKLLPLVPSVGIAFEF